MARENPHEVAKFDYVIIGAGSAGCVLANRLSASGRATVCLIEAGPSARHPYLRIPLGYGRAVGDERFDWCYSTEPEPGLDGRTIGVPRGKVIGGSSSINAMAYVRGHRADFDRWRDLGNPGWGWDDILPYFAKLEDFDRPDGRNRFAGGAMPVRFAHCVHPLCRRIIAASVEAGLPPTEDYNLPDPAGLAIAQINALGGRRFSAAAAYLDPALKRANLRVMVNARVVRIAFAGNRAAGVVVRTAGREERIAARGEVILAAGAVNSPLLLEQSGVGQAERLSQLGIGVVHEAKGVGENVQDHYFSGARMQVRTIGSLNAEVRFPRLAINALRYALTRGGIIGSSLSQLIGYARISPDAPSADIQFIGSATMMRSVVRPEHQEMKLEPDVVPGASLGCYVCRPRSRGSSHMASAAGEAPPRIVLNHLTDERDQHAMVEGLRLCRTILQQPALDDVRVEIISPAEDLETDAQLLAFARSAGGSAYHIVGSCRMGSEPDCVVDSLLRVRGLDRLRVIDSSIMPRIVSANTHAATVAIAEKGSDLVIGAARGT